MLCKPQGRPNDDYEAKYEPDAWGEEAGPNARIWRVYLDEAEAYDHEMVEQWRDTVDSLLVFVSRFQLTFPHLASAHLDRLCRPVSSPLSSRLS